MVVEESEDEDFVREVPARRGSSVKQDIPAIVESKYNVFFYINSLLHQKSEILCI